MKLERKDEILKCIVEEFIKTAQPVGSKTLLKVYNLNCSSATIRNAMVELEKEGMLEKTHVSSGRVPSAKGYQYYLDHLDNSSLMNSVDMEFQREFQEVLHNKSKSVEDVVAKSCEMLSEMTNMATVVLGQKGSNETLVSVQLLRLTEKSAMGIFITDSGYVEKKTFVLDPKDGTTFQQLSNTMAMLNERLAGTKVVELEAKARALQPLVTQTFGKGGDIIMQAFLEALVSFTRKRYEVFGEKKLLSLPEFSNSKESFMNAFSALQDPNGLEKNLSGKDDLGNVNIAFTNENKGDFAIVSKKFNGKDQLAVVGPKRMDYKKVLSALEYTVYMLDRYFFSGGSQATSLVPVSTVEDVKTEKAVHKKKPTTAKKGVRK
jgi:heat-inducible transcriptional repressor